MKVLVTGGTGYLGRAVVRALAARGHELVVFARSASRSGLPGTPSTATSAIARRARARRRRLRRDLALRRAGQHLAPPARRTSTTSTSAGCATCWRPRAPSACRASSTPRRFSRCRRADATRRSRPTTTSGRRSRPIGWPTRRCATAAPLIRVYPGVVYGPGTFTEGNLVGRLIADHSRHGCRAWSARSNRWSYAYVDDVAAGHCAALERGAIGGRYALGGENAPQRRVFEIVQQI